MNDTSANLLMGFLTVGALTVAFFIVAAALCLFAALVTEARDELRDRYCGGGWRPHSVDLLGVPIWIGLELACFCASLLLLIVTVLLAYSAAKDFRDWWHRTDRSP